MRILIISDTHRRNENLFRILDEIEKPDMIVHCGDVEGSEYLISEAAGCKTVIVQGNNDYFSDLPREVVVKIGKYNALVTHGHPYYVNMGYDHLVREAKKRKMNMLPKRATKSNAPIKIRSLRFIYQSSKKTEKPSVYLSVCAPSLKTHRISTLPNLLTRESPSS